MQDDAQEEYIIEHTRIVETTIILFQLVCKFIVSLENVLAFRECPVHCKDGQTKVLAVMTENAIAEYVGMSILHLEITHVGFSNLLDLNNVNLADIPVTIFSTEKARRVVVKTIDWLLTNTTMFLLLVDVERFAEFEGNLPQLDHKIWATGTVDHFLLASLYMMMAISEEVSIQKFLKLILRKVKQLIRHLELKAAHRKSMKISLEF